MLPIQQQVLVEGAVTNSNTTRVKGISMEVDANLEQSEKDEPLFHERFWSLVVDVMMLAPSLVRRASPTRFESLRRILHRQRHSDGRKHGTFCMK